MPCNSAYTLASHWASSSSANRSNRLRGCPAGCCCEVCKTAKTACAECCHCSPLALCVTFTPDNPDADGCDCGGTAKLSWSESGDYGSVQLRCGPYHEVVDFGVMLGVFDGKCYWKLYSDALSIEDYYPVRDSEYGEAGAVGCRKPVFPAYSINVGGCAGTLTIERRENFIVPLEELDDGCTQEWCGDGTCKCLCRDLCVTVGSISRFGTSIAQMDDEQPGNWSQTVTMKERFGVETSTVDIAVQLCRDPYTFACLLVVTVEGEDFTFEIDSCSAISVSFDKVLTGDDPYYPSTIQITCSDCGCGIIAACCQGRRFSRTMNLTGYWCCSSFPLSKQEVDEDLIWDDDQLAWLAYIEASTICDGMSHHVRLRLQCSGTVEGNIEFYLDTHPATTPIDQVPPNAWTPTLFISGPENTLDDAETDHYVFICSPFLLMYRIRSDDEPGPNDPGGDPCDFFTCHTVVTAVVNLCNIAIVES